jgi:hypothetical protein
VLGFITGLIPLQYRILAELALVMVLLCAGFVGGFKVESWRWGASETAAIEKAQQEYRKESDKSASASGELAKQEERVRVQIKTVTKFVDRIVERPVYRADCIDDDGLHAINSALTGASHTGRQSNGAVP